MGFAQSPPPVPPLPASPPPPANNTNPANIFAQMKSGTFASDAESQPPGEFSGAVKIFLADIFFAANYDALRPNRTFLLFLLLENVLILPTAVFAQPTGFYGGYR